MWRGLRPRSGNDIDVRLAAELKRPLEPFHVHVKEMPQFRFVDVFRAAEAGCRGSSGQAMTNRIIGFLAEPPQA